MDFNLLFHFPECQFAFCEICFYNFYIFVEYFSKSPSNNPQNGKNYLENQRAPQKGPKEPGAKRLSVERSDYPALTCACRALALLNKEEI